MVSLTQFVVWIIVGLIGGSIASQARAQGLWRLAELGAGLSRVLPLALAAFLPLDEIGLWRWAIGLLAYVLMLGAHAPVVGVSPLPAFA
jgi:hypothetical protein